jgi:archaellum component FlaC
MKIIEKLSTYAALIGVIGAIGGGFYAWGEFNTRLSVIEKKPPVSLTSLKQKDIALTKQFDEVLLYANEYKVDLIDRIAKVEEKIKPVDLTSVYAKISEVENKIKDTDLTNVFKEIGKVREQIAMLPKPANLQPLLSSLKELEEYAWELEEDIEQLSKDVAIVQKENQVQDAMMEELKLQLKNPLGN